MKCQDVKNNLAAFLDHELASQLTQEIEGHLRSCPGCQQERQEMAQAWALLDSAPLIEPSPDYISRFWTTVSTQETAYQRFIRDFKAFVGGRHLIPVTTVLSLMLIIGSTGIIGQINMQYQFSQIKPDDMEMLQHLDIAQHFQTIQDYQVIKDLDSTQKTGTI